jgi:hypothetical protein
MEIEMTDLFRLSPARLFLAASLCVLALAACTKEKPPEEKVAPGAEASAAPSPDAASAAVDPAREFPKVDPATLTDASPIADVHNALIRPGYQALTDAESTPPTDDAGWKALGASADGVVKGLGLLTTGSRPKDTGEFVKFANAAAEKMKVVQATLAKKDGDSLVLVDGDVLEACNACHGKYRTPK